MLAPEQEPESESFVLRVGFVVAGAVLSTVVSSVPAALRMGEEGSAARALQQWIVLSALGLPACVVAVSVLRRARAGLRLLVGERTTPLAIGVLWWSVVELGLLAVFGALLRKTTHHHALAGVTFAIFALVTGVLVGVFAHRAASMIARGGTSVQKVGLVVAGGAGFLVLLLIGVRTSRADGLHTAALLVDALAVAVTATVASSRLLLRFRALAIAGVPAAVLVLMVGLTTLRFDPRLGESLVESAPVHAAIIELIR